MSTFKEQEGMWMSRYAMVLYMSLRISGLSNEAIALMVGLSSTTLSQQMSCRFTRTRMDTILKLEGAVEAVYEKYRRVK